jgi:hypothetical protein
MIQRVQDDLSILLTKHKVRPLVRTTGHLRALHERQVRNHRLDFCHSKHVSTLGRMPYAVNAVKRGPGGLGKPCIVQSGRLAKGMVEGVDYYFGQGGRMQFSRPFGT